MSPIESYLDHLKANLERRFDSECAERILAEVQDHLAESTAELEDEGIPAGEAERKAVSRFGAQKTSGFLLPLGWQYGTGDRYWGWAAFGIAIFTALGLTWYAINPLGHPALPKEDIRPILTALLMGYAYACWRAKSFAKVFLSTGVVSAIVLLTSFARMQWIDPALREVASNSRYEGYWARRDLPPLASPVDFVSSGFADLGGRSHRPKGTDSPYAAAPSYGDSSEPGSQPLVPGIAPIGGNPWEIGKDGFLPDVAQLLLSWLFTFLMTNAAICWIGSLEHEQKSGILLIQ